MKRSKRLVLSILIGFILYNVLTFFFGDSGYIALQTMKRYEDKLMQNNKELSTINQTLTYQLHRLKSDPELIQLYARRLGYFKDDEYAIRIRGFNTERNFYAVGKMINPPQKQLNREHLFRSISCSIALALYLVFGMISRATNDNQKS